MGDDTIFGGTKPVKFGDIKDGSSNTLWLVEVKAEFAKPWTSPEDYVFDATNPAIGLAELAGEKPVRKPRATSSAPKIPTGGRVKVAASKTAAASSKEAAAKKATTRRKTAE